MMILAFLRQKNEFLHWFHPCLRYIPAFFFFFFLDFCLICFLFKIRYFLDCVRNTHYMCLHMYWQLMRGLTKYKVNSSFVFRVFWLRLKQKFSLCLLRKKCFWVGQSWIYSLSTFLSFCFQYGTLPLHAAMKVDMIV